MAHVLSLIYGGTTVALASGDYRLRKYAPATPESGANSVTETATVLITASSLANLQTDVAAIQKVFERARLRQAGKSLAKVYVKLQGSGESTAWLSEVYDGRVVLPESALAGDWANNQFEVAVIWQRAPFWEGDTWVAVPLSNGNGTDNVAGLNIYNCNDATGSSPNKKHNYCDIDGVNDIATEMPAAVKIEAAYAGMTPLISNIYMGMQADIDGLGLVTAYAEAEDWTLSGGSASADAGASHGHYMARTVAAATTEYLYADVDLSAFKGNYHKWFLRSYSIAMTDLKVRVRIKDFVNNIDLAETQWAYLDNTVFWHKLGDIRMPPGRSKLPTSGTLQDYRIYLDIYTTGGGNIGLDDLHWLPTDSYLEVGMSAGGLSQETLVYVGGLDDRLYRDSATNHLINPFDTVNGSGLWLQPGVNSRLHFLTMDSSGGAGTGDYLTVKMWYKPRRQTL
jgi:hypothetical protein